MGNAKPSSDPAVLVANTGIEEIGKIAEQITKAPFHAAILLIGLAAFICVIVFIVVGMFAKNRFLPCMGIGAVLLIMCICFAFIRLSWLSGMIDQRGDFNSDLRDHNGLFIKNFHHATS